VSEIRVQSWNELQERLYENSWQEGLKRFRSNYAFRGMPDADEDLVTGLAQLGGRFDQTEPYILRAFRKYARPEEAAGTSLWNWLALAQHHGLPTRMLDWTYSPFVALHFVTEFMETFDLDGVVWCVDYVRANALLPQVLKDIAARECAGVFTAEMLDEAADSLGRFDELGKDKPFVVFLEPPSLDARIVNQFALFSLMSSPTARLDQWLGGHPDLYRKLIVPASLKWEVRDKLDQANVTERVLFPGLDGLGRWLRRYYTPKPE
jgi:hypothetical protein